MTWVQWKRPSAPPIGGRLTRTRLHTVREPGVTTCGLAVPEEHTDSETAPPVSEMCCHCGWLGDRPAAPRVGAP